MMYRFVAPLGAFFLTCMALSGAARAAPPVEAFGNLPSISDVQISPDGRHIAMLQAVQGKEVAVIYKVGAPAGTRPAIFNMDDVKIRSVHWANNDRLLVRIAKTEYIPNDKWKRTFEFVRMVSVNTVGQDPVFLFQHRDFRFMAGSGRLSCQLPNDPDHVLIASINPGEMRSEQTRTDSYLKRKATGGLNAYKVNVRTGKEDRVEKGDPDTESYHCDPAGTLRLRIDYDKASTIYASPPGGGRLEQIVSYDDNPPAIGMTFQGFGDDPNKVYFTGLKGSDRLGLYVYDLTSKTVTSTKFLHDRYDIDEVIRDWGTDKIVGVRYIEHYPKTIFFDKTLAGLQKALEGAFKGQSVRLASWSRDRSAVVLRVESPGNPGGYFLFDAGTKQVSPLSAKYPSLQGQKNGKTQPVSYKARDGLTIPAYLTLPPDRPAKNLPLVLLPHGGPEYRDSQSFDWWAGFYASRGYAVLQPNFRGSKGYGAKFTLAGFGEFGGKMQDDLTDGVKYLVAQGIADPKRVCIVGASYGGYAALAGATLTPDVYACAVSVNGVADLNEMMAYAVRTSGSGNETDAMGVRYWERWLGGRLSGQDERAAVSPTSHANRAKAPILLIHGKDDTVVAFEQSRMMANALQKAGKPHRLIALEGEDHWLSKAHSRIRILRETEAFLKEHIGG